MVRFRSCVAVISLSIIVLSVAGGGNSRAQTGFESNRPVFAGACPTCVWGPIGEAVKEAMKPYGEDIQICYSCNVVDSPRYVAKAMRPHPLTPGEKALGDPVPPDGPVDFGVTNAYSLWFLYDGLYDYKPDGAQHQLRLIAFLGDPHYILAATKADSKIGDLKEIAEKKLPVRVMGETTTVGKAILAYYGLTKEALESWGGELVDPSEKNANNFDVVITTHGSLANNEEDKLFYEISQHYNLHYLGLAPNLLDQLVRDFRLKKVDVPLGYLRGVTAPIPTVERNGQAIIGRSDMPDDFAYTLAKAIDLHQGLFQHLNRPYFYDPHHVWNTVGDVPLHPGAARYYKEVGYMK